MEYSNSIINSQLFKKLEDSNDFFSVEDLMKEIYTNLVSDRELIITIFNKALSDSDDLAEQIKTFIGISALPAVTIFGEIPNKYLDNLTNNAQLFINLLNSIQKLQMNYVNSKLRTKGINDDKSGMTLEDFIKESSEPKPGE